MSKEKNLFPEQNVNGNKAKTCFRGITLNFLEGLSLIPSTEVSKIQISGTFPRVSAHVNTKLSLRNHIFPSTET